MKKLLPILTALLVCGASATAVASSIGLSFADGSPCGEAIANQPFVINVFVQMGGDVAAGGFTGAEFRIDGLDPAWFMTLTLNPAANILLGDPVNGCNVVFPVCQGPPVVALFSLSCISSTPVDPRVLHVVRHSTPTNPDFPCPLVTLCNFPDFSIVCVEGGTAFLNTGCQVGTASKTWSGVKGLFR